MFRYALGTGRVCVDVTLGLHDLLMSKLPALLERIETYSGKPETKRAINIMILTFLRTNEMSWGKWPGLQWDTFEWEVPAWLDQGKHLSML